MVSLNLSILHQLRNKFLATYTNLSWFCFLGTTPVLAPNVWANENSEVDTRSQELYSEPDDWKAEALPYDHGHHK